MPPLSIMIKTASSLCNLRCRYCFYHDVSNIREVADSGIMSLDTARTLIKKSLELGGYEHDRSMSGINGGHMLTTGFAHNALVAGFTEIGETLEETVHREVMEETGLKVKNIRYYKSQPWGLANDILMGFFCDVDGDDPIKMDEEELKMACFTEREDIVLQPDDASLTGEMMKVFKENRNERKRTE